MSNAHYDIPTWASKPPAGLHLDVMKGDKLVQVSNYTTFFLKLYT